MRRAEEKMGLGQSCEGKGRKRKDSRWADWIGGSTGGLWALVVCFFFLSGSYLGVFTL